MESSEVVRPVQVDGLDTLVQSRSEFELRADALVIESDADFERAGQEMLDGMRIRKAIEAKLDPHCDAQYAAWKKLTAWRKEELEKVDPGIAVYKRKIADYATEQARKRKIEEERIRAEARAEEEKRLAEERRERDERIKREEDQRLAAVQERIEAGDTETAEAILEQPVEAKVERQEVETQRQLTPVYRPSVRIAPPKAAGVSTRTITKYRITDPTKINRAYLMADETRIANQVKATGKDSEAIVGGIEVYDDVITVGRTK